MKVELKKLAIYERLSEETIAFAADVWIDGKLVGHAKNKGHGGSTFVDWAWVVTPVRRQAIETALKAVVPAEYTSVSGIEWAVDQIVEQKRQAKEDAKYAKKVAKNDATYKESCAKLGRACARFDLTSASSKETRWVEYLPGSEAATKADALKKHPHLVNWTVIA